MRQIVYLFLGLVAAWLVADYYFQPKPVIEITTPDRYRDRIGAVIADDGSGRIITLYERKD